MEANSEIEPVEPLLVSRDEAARVMGVSLPTVDRWIKDAGTSFVAQFGGNGRAYQIDIKKLKAWRDGVILEEQRAEELKQEALQQIELEFTGASKAPEGAALTVDHRKKLLEEQLTLLKLQQQRGELVEVTRAALAHETRLKLVADFLVGMPDALARRLNWTVDETKACAEAVEKMQEILARRLMKSNFLD